MEALVEAFERMETPGHVIIFFEDSFLNNGGFGSGLSGS
jgi:hypothetical protein